MFGSTGRLGPDAARRLFERSGGHVMVNLICEPHLERALKQVARFELETELPLVNPSWSVSATTRPLIARRLAHQAGVHAPQCTHDRAGTLTLAEHIEAHGQRYPVLLRPPGKHGSVGLVRVGDADEVSRQPAMSRACTVTDFVDFRSSDGLWRKYRMVYVGDRLFRRHVLTDRTWNLTREARGFMHDRPELAAEEQEWIKRPVTLESGSVEARVMHQFRALQLDFGAIDVAVPPAGIWSSSRSTPASSSPTASMRRPPATGATSRPTTTRSSRRCCGRSARGRLRGGRRPDGAAGQTRGRAPLVSVHAGPAPTATARRQCFSIRGFKRR